MPGILSFLGHLCCSDFEKFTFFSISREDNRKFLKKNFCFSKKFHRQGLWGGKVIFEISSTRMKIFSEIYSTRMKRNFFKNLLKKDEDKNLQKIYSTRKKNFFLNFHSFSINIFQKSKNPIGKDEEKIDFQNQVKAHTQKSFFCQKNAKIFNEKKSKF